MKKRMFMMNNKPYDYCRLTRYISLTLILITLMFVRWNESIVLAAEEKGFHAYNNSRFTEVMNLLQSGMSDTLEADFLRAATTSDADAAVEIYRRLVLSNPESEIAMRALDRIRQYYYAQGLYSRAADLAQALGGWKLSSRQLRTPETTPPPLFSLTADVLPRIIANKQTEPTPKPPESQTGIQPKETPEYHFCLQIGAFSSPTNAESYEEKFGKAGYNVVITSPNQENRLYLVKIIGYETIEAAFEAASEIQRNFSIQPIVVPWDE
jgi:cell division septation protein DedD